MNSSLWTREVSTTGTLTTGGGNVGKKNAAEGIMGAYASILAEKIATIEDELERLEKVREDIEEIDTLRRDAEERGTIRTQLEMPETVKRVLGDGSILVTTTKDGRIIEQYRKKPHLVAVPDDTAPKDALPSEKYKWVPRHNPLDMLQFM